LSADRRQTAASQSAAIQSTPGTTDARHQEASTMFTAYRSIRPLAACLLASAAIAAVAAVPAAAADSQAERAQATEQYLQSFGAPAPQQDQRAQATEQYLQSYGAPEPIVPSVPTSETPWLPIVLAGACVAIGFGAVQVRRVRMRRRTGVRLAT
jgi:hypothetical protein